MASEEAGASPGVPALDNVNKAFALARLGIKVFPVDHTTRSPKLSEKQGGRGFYDATSDDFEKIATWFTVDFPEAKTEVGVWVGGSGLLALDVDRGKPNGKDGFKSIKTAGHVNELGNTHHYRTSSGGEHRIFATDDLSLAPGSDVLGLEGVDIRAGGSYIVWWGNTVPESRAAFSTDIPEWILKAASNEASFTGEGFSGTVEDWLEAIPDDILPSSKARDLIARIPERDFGHPEMVDLAWAIVRMGSERETGIRKALDELRSAWLRPPYDTPKFRHDFDMALRGAIVKAGRVQNPIPAITSLSTALAKANELGVGSRLKSLERKVSETDSEIEFARVRREMFEIAAKAGLSPASALGIVTGSKSFRNSKASIDSAWFGDGESFFHDQPHDEEADPEPEPVSAPKSGSKQMAQPFAADAAAFTFLTEAEQKIAEDYKWIGKEYLAWVESRLKHFNKPYHVSALWAALSVISSPWGKVKSRGGRATDCNLYIASLGDSTSGKSESWSFGLDFIDAYYGVENGPIIGDIGKLSALALHRQLILRDGQPSLVYGDEIQSFFQGVSTTQWQNGILGDLSSHYGGDVSPKLTLNDKEISGKRAKTMLTTYLTGIADQTLDAISIRHWTNGFFYRFLWSFGEPRHPLDFEITFSASSTTDYKDRLEKWARELHRVGAFQEVRWGAGREVEWEEDARKRMEEFTKQIDDAVNTSSLYDTVFISANTRFLTSIMKCATIVALTEAAEKVTLNHVLVALSFAGPWHRSMVLAVLETGKEPFDRDVEKCLAWIRRNAVRQVGKTPWIQRSAVMRAFKPNEIAERLLRQLTEEGWLLRSGDKYELSEE